MDSRTKKIVKNFVQAALISAAISSTIVAISTGVNNGFVDRWLSLYRFALPLAFTMRMFVLPKLVKVKA